MLVKLRAAQNKTRRENKKRRPKPDRKITASAGAAARELIHVR
jgi:hypothetical protein